MGFRYGKSCQRIIVYPRPSRCSCVRVIRTFCWRAIIVGGWWSLCWWNILPCTCLSFSKIVSIDIRLVCYGIATLIVILILAISSISRIVYGRPVGSVLATALWIVGCIGSRSCWIHGSLIGNCLVRWTIGCWWITTVFRGGRRRKMFIGGTSPWSRRLIMAVTVRIRTGSCRLGWRWLRLILNQIEVSPNNIDRRALGDFYMEEEQ